MRSTTLGKFSKAGDDPARIVHEYQLASNSLGSAPFYLSVKPPALDFDLGHAAAITATAIRNGHGIHFDSHEHVQADRTMQLLQEVMDQHGSTKRGWMGGGATASPCRHDGKEAWPTPAGSVKKGCEPGW